MRPTTPNRLSFGFAGHASFAVRLTDARERLPVDVLLDDERQGRLTGLTADPVIVEADDVRVRRGHGAKSPHDLGLALEPRQRLGVRALRPQDLHDDPEPVRV